MKTFYSWKKFFKQKHGRRKAETRWTAEQLQAMCATCRVACHVVRRDSSAFKGWNCIYLSFILLAEPLTNEVCNDIANPPPPLKHKD